MTAGKVTGTQFHSRSYRLLGVRLLGEITTAHGCGFFVPENQRWPWFGQKTDKKKPARSGQNNRVLQGFSTQGHHTTS